VLALQLSDYQIIDKVVEKIHEYKILRTQVNNFENCLKVLDEVEREIIERKYMAVDPDKDISIYLDLGIQKNKFYEKKRSAISKLARVLGR
jgi:ArpU family phage transcriptional regulator